MKTKSSPIIAFHGDLAIKAKYLARVEAHQRADEIVAGQYWENGKGCAVGCTLHSGVHRDYETELGIPQVLARLEDRLFEGLYAGDPSLAKAWPSRFLNAPKPGADLSMIWPKFAYWLLVDEKYGVIRFAKNERNREAIRGIGELYRQWCDGVKPATELWVKARTDAYADADAAYAAYAADAYADAYADAARHKARVRMADKLIELINAA